MYLWGTEWGQQGQLISGVTLALLGTVREQSPGRAQAQGAVLGAPGCGGPEERSRDEVAVGRWRRGRGSWGSAQQTANDCCSTPCQPNEL